MGVVVCKAAKIFVDTAITFCKKKNNYNAIVRESTIPFYKIGSNIFNIELNK